LFGVSGRARDLSGCLRVGIGSGSGLILPGFPSEKANNSAKKPKKLLEKELEKELESKQIRTLFTCNDYL
jgi:hypothetical protein